MDFIEYLIRVRNMKEVSARQYNNRLENLISKNIYNKELIVSENILAKIKLHYKDTTNHYPRTINYYIKYQNYINQKESS